MVTKKTCVPGQPAKRGMGIQKYPATGGRGASPRFGGAADDFWVHPALTSIPRLRVISYLANHIALTVKDIARALNLSESSVRYYIESFNSYHFVQGTPVYGAVRPAPTPGLVKMLWNITKDGRKHLWRYAWVTTRVCGNYSITDTFDRQAPILPWNALRDDAHYSLLRPVALAAASYIRFYGPAAQPELERINGFRQGAADIPIAAWRKLGWIDAARPKYDPLSRFHKKGHRHAPKWQITRAGIDGMERHGTALVWAGFLSGYEDIENDKVFNDQDLVHYLKFNYYSPR